MASCLTIVDGVPEVGSSTSAACTGWLVLDQYEYDSLVMPNGQSREENFADGMAVGWAIASVLVVAWCWLMMRRAAK